MLKALMIRKKLNDAQKELEALRAKSEELAKREAELEADIAAASTEEEQQAVEAAVTEFEAEKTEAYNKIVRQMEELTAALKSYNEKYGLYRANKTNFINFPLMSASAFWDNILKF